MMNPEVREMASPAAPAPAAERHESESSAASSRRAGTPPASAWRAPPPREERGGAEGPRAPETELRFTPEVSPALSRLVDEHVVPCLTPSQEAMQHRMEHLRYLAKILTGAISSVAWRKGVQYGDIRYYVFGSVRMRTVLPDGDNDVTIEVDGLTNPTRVVGPAPPLPAGADAAAESSDGGSGGGSGNVNGSTAAVREESPMVSPAQAEAVAGGELLSSVVEYLRENETNVYVDALVLAEVRVLKLAIAGSSYDVTVGQLGGVDCVRFLHEMDTMVGQQHLVKRTLLLLKAWCCYEAHILGGQGGYISSYAATVMLFAILNNVEFLEDVEDAKGGKREVTPLQLFTRFLKFYSYFDFERYCVTVFGPLPCTSINGTALDLSRLEVPAAHTRPNRGNSETDKDGHLENGEGGIPSVDTNELGLTAEGKAALGHLVRRRAKPFLTVSGVRRFLHKMRRRRESERRVRMGEELPSAFPRDDQVRLDRPGCASADVDLDCPMCVTDHFPVRTMNVMDPLRWSSNTCRGVCRNHLQRIRRAFLEGLALLRAATARVQDPPSASGSATSSNSGTEGSASVSRSATKNELEVLHALFGQAMKAAGPQYPMQPQPAAELVKCKQCTRPSVFCVLDPRHVCDAQFVFGRQDNALVAQQQQQQQQMNMLAGQGAAASPIPATSSLSELSGGRCRCSPSTPNNSNSNNRGSNTGTPTAPNNNVGGNENGSAEAGPATQHYARGLPLMRANGTALMATGGLGARGGGGGGGYADYGAACYPIDPVGFPFFPGSPGIPGAGHAKRGGPVGFALPPPPSGGALAPKHSVRGYSVVALPLSAQGHTRMGGSQAYPHTPQ